MMWSCGNNIIFLYFSFFIFCFRVLLFNGRQLYHVCILCVVVDTVEMITDHDDNDYDFGSR